MVHDWTQDQTMSDWMRSQEKRTMRQERRAATPKAADILGPGIAPQAVEVHDWSDDSTEFNGFFFSRPGAMHSPDSTGWWIGFSLTQEGQWGIQRVWDYQGEASPPAEFTRTFQIMGSTRLFTTWVNSGVGASIGMRTFREDEPPTGLDANDVGRAIWYDTNDGDHPYLWSETATGLDWVSMRGDGAVGPEGPEGPEGPAGEPGDPGLVWRGVWAAGTAYAVNDAVAYGSSSYRRKVAGTTATVPSLDPANWEPLATGLTARGAWAAGTAYAVNDTVTLNGSTYRRKVAGTTPGSPATDTPNWELIAQQGAPGDEGPEGPAGEPGSDGPPGEPGLVWRGAWNQATSYQINNAVTYNGSSYRRLTVGTSTNPPSADAINWEPLAVKGDPGDEGPEGPPGEDATTPPPQQPTATPILDPTGMVTQILVKVPYQANPTPAVMDLWVGPATLQVGGLLPLNSATYHGATSASIYVIEKLADGAALMQDTDYVVVGRWRTGTPTSPLYGPRSADYTVRLGKIGDDSIASLKVDKLLTGEMTAAVTLSGIFKTAEAGPRVENGPSGMQVWGTRTDKPDVNLPTDGSGPDFRGNAELEGATFTGDAAFRSNNNEWAPTSVSTLRKGTTAPVSAPSPTIDWEYITPQVWGGYGLHWDGTYLVTASSSGPPSATRIDPVTGVTVGLTSLGTSSDYHYAHGGIVTIGSSYYTLGWKWNVSNRSYDWSIRKYALTGGAPQVEVAYTPYSSSPYASEGFDDQGEPTMCIGTDGTNVLICDRHGDTGKLRVQHRNPSTLALLTSPATVTSTIGTSLSPVAVMKGTFDFGATRFVIATVDNANNYVFDSNMALVSNEAFPSPAAPDCNGMTWDGSVFRASSGASPGRIYKHTNIRWTSETATWSAKYGWINGVGQETLQSPVRTFTMKRRARVTLTGTTIPSTATGTAHYITRAGAAAWERKTASSTQVTYSTQPTWTTTPLTVPTFPDGTPAKHKTDAGGYELDGLGQGAWPYVQPVGAVTMYAGVTAPPGWLLCDGQDVSTAVYANLYAVIGHKFNGNVSPGSGLFRLPDMVDRFPVGAGTGTGSSLGLGSDDSLAKGATRYDRHDHDHGHGNTLGTGVVGSRHEHSLAISDPNMPSASNTTTGGGATRLTGGAAHVHPGSTAVAGMANEHTHNVTGSVSNGGKPGHPRTAFNFIIKF